jgi:peroxiredoxin
MADSSASVDARLAGKLLGLSFPTTRLGCYSGAPMGVSELGKLLVIYFYPGCLCSPEDGYWSPVRDTAQHGAFAYQSADLLASGYAPVGLSSQSVEVQRRVVADTGIRHTLLSDPELKLAQALGLPTFNMDQTDCTCSGGLSTDR